MNRRTFRNMGVVGRAGVRISQIFGEIHARVYTEWLRRQSELSHQMPRYFLIPLNQRLEDYKSRDGISRYHPRYGLRLVIEED